MIAPSNTRMPSSRASSEELAAIGVLVPAIFIAVAVLLLHASMLRIIELQRAQIGIVKALGLAGDTIGWHYVKFALVLAGAATLLGLPVGIVLGYGVTRIYAEFFHFPFLRYRPDLLAAAGVVAALAAAAALAAVHPVRRALALRPAVAMFRQRRSPTGGSPANAWHATSRRRSPWSFASSAGVHCGPCSRR